MEREERGLSDNKDGTWMIWIKSRRDRKKGRWGRKEIKFSGCIGAQKRLKTMVCMRTKRKGKTLKQETVEEQNGRMPRQ